MTQADESAVDLDGMETEQATETANETDNLEAVDQEPSESSPEQAAKPEQKIEFSPEQQAVVDKIAAEKTFKLREAERKAEQERRELQQQIEAMRSKLPQEKRPEVPEYPDRYDFDNEEQFRQAVRQRDELQRQQMQYDARQEAVVAQREEQKRLQAQQQQQQLVEQAKTYTSNAEKMGIKAEELQQAGNMVAQYGLSDELAGEILQDEQGPLITKYLANNVAALDQLVRATPYQAGMLMNSIKAEAVKLKPNVSRAPEPVDHLNGNGAPPQERGPKGATFE